MVASARSEAARGGCLTPIWTLKLPRGTTLLMDTCVKICGLSTSDSVIAARDGGASHLGFIFFNKSPRDITPGRAAQLVKDAGHCATVAVTVNASDEFLDDIVATMAPSMLQLHGSESVERVAEVKARYELPVIKALAVRTNDDLAKARDYEKVADMLLLDAKPPAGSDLPGGNGVSFDWSLVEKFKPAIPVLLSGGIDLSNIEPAMALVADAANGFTGVDLSSGVESAPGVKDLEKIAMLLSACRETA